MPKHVKTNDDIKKMQNPKVSQLKSHSKSILATSYITIFFLANTKKKNIIWFHIPKPDLELLFGSVLLLFIFSSFFFHTQSVCRFCVKMSKFFYFTFEVFIQFFSVVILCDSRVYFSLTLFMYPTLYSFELVLFKQNYY